MLDICMHAYRSILPPEENALERQRPTPEPLSKSPPNKFAASILQGYHRSIHLGASLLT